jgi:hypothetical protein
MAAAAAATAMVSIGCTETDGETGQTDQCCYCRPNRERLNADDSISGCMHSGIKIN